ncbi:MAG: zinc ribbon domain-containing protein [Ktedonobacterales bacterium]
MRTKRTQLDWREGRRRRAWELKEQGWKQQDIAAALAVPPASTLQDCPSCGMRILKSLSVRTHVCTSCGLVMDRDENAARTMHWVGQ